MPKINAATDYNIIHVARYNYIYGLVCFLFCIDQLNYCFIKNVKLICIHK